MIEELLVAGAVSNNISNPFSKAGDALWGRSDEVDQVEWASFGKCIGCIW
jgi:hypothetical protein